MRGAHVSIQYGTLRMPTIIAILKNWRVCLFFVYAHREELLEVELQMATMRCEELRNNLQV